MVVEQVVKKEEKVVEKPVEKVEPENPKPSEKVKEVKSTEKDVDGDGVPYKNRYHESLRKLKDAERDREEIKNQMNLLKKQIDKKDVEETEVQEDEGWKHVREVAREEYEKVSMANLRMMHNLDKLEQGDPDIKKHRKEIEDTLANLKSLDLRENMHTVESVADRIIGSHIRKSRKKTVDEPEQESENKTKLTPIKTSSTSIPETTETDDELTKEEDAFADRRGYYDHDYSNQEIKDRYKKYKERLEKNKEK